MISKAQGLLLSLAMLPFLGACGDDGGGTGQIIDAGMPDAEPVATFEECGASDQAFVRNASLALLGTRPKSQAQVNVYTDLMAALINDVRYTARQVAAASVAAAT